LLKGLTSILIISENSDGSWVVATKKVTIKQLRDELEVARALKRDILADTEIRLAPVNADIERLKADIDEINARKAPKPKPIPEVDGYIYDNR
jgi:hypothetical protein